MEWLNQSEIEINEHGDRLEVIVRTQTGMLEWALSVSVSVFVVFLFARAMPILGLLVAAIAALSLIRAIRKGDETRLTVSSEGFVVQESVTHRQTVSIDELHGIGYFVGDDGDPTGLYAFKPLSYVCLLPNLDESECERIKYSIESKFPDMQFGKEPITSLFGDPEIISLGLNRQAGPDANPPVS